MPSQGRHIGRVNPEAAQDTKRMVPEDPEQVRCCIDSKQVGRYLDRVFEINRGVRVAD